ncbi:MAG: NAD(P)/FAD-dependent oxidoreductase [Bradyrhizobiaceae bacterium]|nr:MAG: NAD(P)/FAD-dependent oxidoreductase [Bradyrhizobiaceae bacterium]
MATPLPAERHRIIIVGGGAGGLELATRLGHRLRRSAAQVTLVDRNPAHLWKPRLHEVAAGLIGSGDDETNYLAHGCVHGFEFMLGGLNALDPATKTITLDPVLSPDTGAEVLGTRVLPYDTLVLALGSRVNDFNIPGVLEYCHMLDSPAQAMRLQREFLEAAIRVGAGLLDRVRVGIVGAGATGVELAAELHHAVHAMERWGGLGAAGKLDITLVDMANRILPAVDPATSKHAMKVLEKLGVNVVLGKGVDRVTADALHLSGGGIVPCEIKVWASGVAGHDVIGSLKGLTLSAGKRIVVDDHLACVGVSDIFAMGDCAAAPSHIGKGTVPPTAQAAHQQASYLTKALERRLVGETVGPFLFKPRGTLVSLGINEAACEFPALRRDNSVFPAYGTIAKLLYVSLYHMHRVALHGWLRATALFIADRLRRTTLPPVKLH